MYENLIVELRNMAKVYKLCGQEKTTEYRLATQAADAIEDLVKKMLAATEDE